MENARDLYRRLLARTSHPKVWLAFAKFEEDQVEQESDTDYHAARDVYREATDKLKEIGAEKVERLMILEQWLEFEKKLDDAPNLNYVKECGKNSLICTRKLMSYYEFWIWRQKFKILGYFLSLTSDSEIV